VIISLWKNSPFRMPGITFSPKEEMAPNPKPATFAILPLPFYLGMSCIKAGIADDF